jgi:hypothetical protein
VGKKVKRKESFFNFMIQSPKSKQHKNTKEHNTHNAQPLWTQVKKTQEKELGEKNAFYKKE